MAWVAVAVGGAALVGGILQSNAAQNAANTQANAANNATEMQWNMYQQQRSDYEPWRQAGQTALGDLTKNNFMQNWQQDPGYQFRLDQGNKAINAAAAARGMANSGRTLKELTEYGQNFATNEYNNVYNRQYNRLSALAGFGQNANAQNSANGNNFSNAANANMIGSANAAAASNMAQANAWGNALNTGVNAYMFSRGNK